MAGGEHRFAYYSVSCRGILRPAATCENADPGTEELEYFTDLPSAGFFYSVYQ